ncbi:MAG TPA: hypothetical protein VNZ22_21180, partial [Bacillota bacterium]|nr:hypothetical protein [Bacillota bacterium]
RLPHLLLTHGDLRHIGGAELLAELFAVQQVGVSPARSRSATYRQALAHFGQTTNWLCTLNRNDPIGPWKLLHPDTADRFTRGDDNALVLLGRLHGTRILLLSDLGRAGQDALLARTADLRADIVVTGPPSTGEPLCEALLDAIHPRLIVIADAEFPASERANPKLRDRLAQRNVPVVYTRFSGAATIEFRPGRWELRTMSGLKLSGT